MIQFLQYNRAWFLYICISSQIKDLIDKDIGENTDLYPRVNENRIRTSISVVFPVKMCTSAGT
jgi:hypothetical protein